MSRREFLSEWPIDAILAIGYSHLTYWKDSVSDNDGHKTFRKKTAIFLMAEGKSHPA